MNLLQKPFGVFCLLMLFSHSIFSQELSNLAKNFAEKLEKEHYPNLKARKEKIEANRKTIASQECNDYIDALNNAVAVWNNIPKKEYNHPTIVKIGKPLDEYLAFGKTAQQIYKERKAAEDAGNITTTTNSANSNKKSFKVGDKISAFYNNFPHTDWMEGTIKGIENGLYVVDVTAPEKYKGTQKLSANMLYQYWNYVEFLENMTKTNKSKIFKFLDVMHEICDNCASGFSRVNLNGDEILRASQEVDYVASVLKQYPPIPSDNDLKDDYNTNPKTYKMVVDKKKEFFEKKYGEMIQEHLKVMYENDFSPVSIFKNEQLTYDGKTTVFWSDVLCGNPENIKKTIIKDLNNYLSQAGMSNNAETYLVGWDDMVARKKKKFEEEANTTVNWKQKYPFSDANGTALVKRDFGGSPIKVFFETASTSVYGGKDKDKRKYGVAFYKQPNCPYYSYIKFSIFEKYTGIGKYAAPRCLYSNAGYTKNIP